MKGTWKIIGVCLAVVMCVSAFVGCGPKQTQSESTLTLNGDAIYPIQTDETLSVWMPLDSRLEGRFENFGDTPLGKALEERTGVKVEYIHPQAGQATEQLNILIASDELPDIVVNNWLGYGGGPDKTIEEGYIYSLNDAFKNYTPALSKFLKENPDIDKQIKTDGGNYFVFPFVRGEDWQTTYQGLILRKDWLDKLGLEEPKTLDELENVLVQFKTLSNGAPLVLNTGQLRVIFHAYNTAPDFYVQGGRVVWGYATQEYKDALERIAKWYAEGLIDNNLVSVDDKYIQSRILNGDAGAYVGLVVSGIGAMLDAKPADQPNFDLVAVTQPTLDGGIPEFTYKEWRVLAGNCVAVSTNCKNPELAARWLDYGFTNEGHMLYNFGIEGESYELVDGEPVFTDLITNNPDGLTFAQAAVMYTRSPYSGIFVADPRYVKASLTYPQQEQAYEAWSKTNMGKHLIPPITLMPDEQSKSAENMSNLSTYVSEKMVSYITGQESLDTFDDYLKQMYAYNLADELEVRQTALDRYNKR